MESLARMLDEYDRMVATIREQEATIQVLKSRLPYWAETIENDSDWSEGELLRSIQEMRETADQL